MEGRKGSHIKYNATLAENNVVLNKSIECWNYGLWSHHRSYITLIKSFVVFPTILII